MSQSGDEVDQPAQLDGQVGNEYGQVKEYIPMEGPLEFDTMEEREAAFDELLLAAYGNTEWPELKRKVWKSLEKLCVYDGRWSAKPSMTVEKKKEMFDVFKEATRKKYEKEELMREKEEVNMKSLVYAASGSDQKRAPERIKMLVRLGTDPNCRLPLSKRVSDIKPSKKGKTAMYAAAKHGRLESIEVLHTLGADVDQAKDNGCTPVYVAAEHNQPQAITLLHNLGADIEKAKKDGYTPILVATQNRNLECVVALHSLGADINRPNKVGQTPLSHAVQKGDKEIEGFLRGLGATLGTEHMTLDTVDDIVEFFEVLGILPEHIPNFKKNLRSAEVYGAPIDGDTLFAIPDGDAMRILLDEEMHDTWGFAFRDIVQHHKAWQEQRKKDKEAEVEAAEGGDEYGSGHGPEEEEGEGRGED